MPRFRFQLRVLPVRNHLPARTQNLFEHRLFQGTVCGLHLNAVNRTPHGAHRAEYVGYMRWGRIDDQFLCRLLCRLRRSRRTTRLGAPRFCIEPV